MYFSDLTCEQMYAVNGGCGLCVAGSVIGGAGTIGGIVASLTPAAPAVIAGCIIGGLIGYWMTT